jgi:hypothetical protein
MIHNIESVAVGLFVLDIFCLPCSLSGGEVLLNCSMLRKRCCSWCCSCCHKQGDGHANNENDDGEQQRRPQQSKPPSYENLTEFIFESDNDPSTIGILKLNKGNYVQRCFWLLTKMESIRCMMSKISNLIFYRRSAE